MTFPTVDGASSCPAPPSAGAASDAPRPGLSPGEAAERLRRDGPNRLPPPSRPSALRRLGRELVHFFALLLWGASLLSLVAGLPELAIAIAAVVLVNAVFSFVQENRADRAAERLRALLPQRVTVRRAGGRVEVDADEVVAGDVLLLDAGDRVPADATLASANALLVDTSLLTGESVPTNPEVGNGLFAGTFVVEGEGEATVTATGLGTRLAGIARLTTVTAKPTTPLARDLRRVVRAVTAIALTVGGAFFVLTLALGEPLDDGLVFAIGVTVALVPEALLPTVTLSLAWGAEQMAKRQVLVRDLEAVETLGSTTFICTDKTGTLTRNEMSVVEAWWPAGGAEVTGVGYQPDGDVRLVGAASAQAACELALAAVRCSVGFAQVVEGHWRAHGDPMEAAVDVFARRLGVDTDQDRRATAPRARFPFDPRRRRMSVVVGDTVVVKGAPDAVLPLCEPEAGAPEALASFTERGLRALAVAGRACGAAAPPSASEAESGLRLLGLLGLQDPPRDDAHDAVAACRAAGIRVAMVTGDHPATAAAVATQVGLREPTGPVLEGRDLPEDDTALGELVDRDGVVVARVSPEDKLRIARALRQRGHVVAMTGDGVNDGPALHEANIGIAMGESGTDVAREAADLVLLDDRFASIVAGVEQGRSTFVNIRRFLTYHLTDNVAELTPLVVWGLSGGRIPLALGVLQILALDLGTDTLSAVALGAEPPAPHLLEGPPVGGRLLNHTVARRAFGLLGPIEAAMSMLAFLVSCAVVGWRPGEAFPSGHALAAASGAAFMAVVLAQAANAFACRSSTRWPGALGWATNRLLPPAIGLGLAFSLLVLLVPPLAVRLDQASPPLAGWLAAAAAVPVLLAADAADKARRRRRSRGRQARSGSAMSARLRSRGT